MVVICVKFDFSRQRIIVTLPEQLPGTECGIEAG
jgi:hypothetical protein